jgi:hypothetical protein
MPTQPKPPAQPPKPSPPPPPGPAAPSAPKASTNAQPHPPRDPDDEDAAAGRQTDTPEPARTIADEQRERSEDIQRQGVEAWKAERDERDPDEKPRQVSGVSPRVNDPGAPPTPEAGSWAGSTRSTPEARDAQSRGAP